MDFSQIGEDGLKSILANVGALECDAAACVAVEKLLDNYRLVRSGCWNLKMKDAERLFAIEWRIAIQELDETGLGEMGELLGRIGLSVGVKIDLE